MEREILLLGNPQLYEISEDVKKEELEDLRPVFEFCKGQGQEILYRCIAVFRHAQSRDFNLI